MPAPLTGIALFQGIIVILITIIVITTATGITTVTVTIPGIMGEAIIILTTGGIHLCMARDILLFRETVSLFILVVILIIIITGFFMDIIQDIISPYFRR